jgi:arylsulfatase A-like enzyme
MIMKRTKLGVVLGVILTCAAGSLVAAADTRPNFVVIMAEAQAWAGSSVQMDDQVPASRSTVFKTPALERLAREGMRFAYGYAASPRCTPSRAALFTGRSPAALRMTYVGVGRESADVVAGRKSLPPEPILEMPERVVTVGKVLQAAGYATAHFGKWHVGRTAPGEARISGKRWPHQQRGAGQRRQPESQGGLWHDGARHRVCGQSATGRAAVLPPAFALSQPGSEGATFQRRGNVRGHRPKPGTAAQSSR